MPKPPRNEHRSHFGSRYTLGCCACAGLFATTAAYCPCCLQAMFCRRSLQNELRTLRWHFILQSGTIRNRRETNTVAILAQGTHWAVAPAQAFLLPLLPTAPVAYRPCFVAARSPVLLDPTLLNTTTSRTNSDKLASAQGNRTASGLTPQLARA